MVTLATAALSVGAAAGTGTATAARDQAPPTAAVAESASNPAGSIFNVAAQALPETVNYATPTTVNYAAPFAQVATVKVTNALLRAQPNTSSTKLDVSQPGRKVTVYCWHDYTDASHYVWFWSYPHGSKFHGWMRADLLKRTGPFPPKC